MAAARRCLRTAGKYTADELDTFAQLFALTTEAQTMAVIGQAYGNGVASRLTANRWLKCCIGDDEVGRTGADVARTSRGGGATRDRPLFSKRGVGHLQVTNACAIDIDIKAVQMCYIQLSLLGIPAGDSRQPAHNRNGRTGTPRFTSCMAGITG